MLAFRCKFRIHCSYNEPRWAAQNTPLNYKVNFKATIFSKNCKFDLSQSIEKLCLLAFTETKFRQFCGAIKRPVYNLAFFVKFVCIGKHR